MKKAWGKSERIVGLYLPNENEILLSRELEREELRHTVLHEFIHACDHQLAEFEEEDRCDTMAKWIGEMIA